MNLNKEQAENICVCGAYFLYLYLYIFFPLCLFEFGIVSIRLCDMEYFIVLMIVHCIISSASAQNVHNIYIFRLF